MLSSTCIFALSRAKSFQSTHSYGIKIFFCHASASRLSIVGSFQGIANVTGTRRPVSRLFPFKIFPPRVISIFVKNKEETRRLASPISMLWEGDANSAPSSRKFITVSRCIPSSPSSNYASYPLLECDENHPLSPSVGASRNYPLETRYKTRSVAKLRLLRIQGPS